MRTQLYLWDNLREKKKNELKYIKDFYFERIYPNFENPEEEAEEYRDKIWNDSINAAHYSEDYEPDFESLAGDCEEAAYDKYEILSLMKYRNLGMWISCLCQVWEQQLITFVKHEMEKDGWEFTGGTDFNEVKECFKIHNQNLENMKNWNKIKELRLIVNVLKHAEGNSADILRKIRPSLFNWSSEYNIEGDKLEFHKSTLLEETLNISNEDFIEYYNILIEFWNELPETMYSDELEE
jgi:hypothetical protein